MREAFISGLEFVKVKKTPSDTGEIVEILPRNYKVYIRNEFSGFYEIRYGEDGIGFIPKNLCTLCLIREEDYHGYNE